MPIKVATPMKRPAVAKASASKKVCIAGPLADKCDKIAGALEKADQSQVPESVTRMLRAVLLPAFRESKKERHPYKASVIDMVSEVLHGIETSSSNQLVEAKARLDAAVAKKAEHEDAAAEVGKVVAKAKDTTKATRVTSDELGVSVADAKAKLAETKRNQVVGDTELDAAERRRAELLRVQSDCWEPIKTKPHEGPEGKAAFDTIAKIGREIGFEGSLLGSLELVLSREAAARGFFDNIVLQQTDIEFAKHVAKLSTCMEEGAPAKETRAAAVETDQQLLDALTVRLEASLVALTEAEVVEQQANVAAKAANSVVIDSFNELRVRCNEVDGTKVKLATFREGPLAVLRELGDRTDTLPAVDNRSQSRANGSSSQVS